MYLPKYHPNFSGALLTACDFPELFRTEDEKRCAHSGTASCQKSLLRGLEIDLRKL